MFIVCFAYALVGLIWFLDGIKREEEKKEWNKIAEDLLNLPRIKASPTFQEELDAKIEKAKKMNEQLLSDLSKDIDKMGEA